MRDAETRAEYAGSVPGPKAFNDFVQEAVS
jgi:hypothetical protein